MRFVKNQRNGRTIKNVYQRSVIFGLMFRNPSRALLSFPAQIPAYSSSIWTPFMRFRIDVAFVDKTGAIVEIIKNLGPWKIYRPSRGTQHILEVESGVLDEFDFRVGDKIEFS